MPANVKGVDEVMVGKDAANNVKPKAGAGSAHADNGSKRARTGSEEAHKPSNPLERVLFVDQAFCEVRDLIWFIRNFGTGPWEKVNPNSAAFYADPRKQRVATEAIKLRLDWIINYAINENGKWNTLKVPLEKLGKLGKSEKLEIEEKYGWRRVGWVLHTAEKHQHQPFGEVSHQ